ncbi:MAG: biopolymer transporter ExbD [Lentisphaeria bacterium]|jgi:biopolymer transport protein ExbD|nr:biopolymer transporter ExbD [Lentisphaeria bacterium]
MSRHRKENRLQSITSINVTPLMDLTFLLLIVFMITAPVLEYAVDVTPPALNAEPVVDTVHKIINLTRGGDIRIDKKTLSLAELENFVQGLEQTAPDTRYHIRADESRPYGEVITIMRTIKNVGITDVSLLTLVEE